MSNDPWIQHSVGANRPTPHFTYPDCKPLEEVYHVTHIVPALHIIEQGQIRAGLIYDESLLRQSRTTVVWLSPNEWDGAGGSRYGNVEFVFDWKALTEWNEAYRVEIQRYRPPAFRILLASLGSSHDLPPYKAAEGIGPWLWDSDEDKHYWNGQICLEIMYESSISLNLCREIRFCTHHKDRCCINRRGTCTERGFDGSRGGAWFVAGLMARGLSSFSNLLTSTDDNGIKIPSSALIQAWSGLWPLLRDKSVSYSGKFTQDSPAAPVVARAIISALVRGDVNDKRMFSRQFSSESEMMAACRKAVEQHFSVTFPEWS